MPDPSRKESPHAALAAAGDLSYDWDLVADTIVWHGAVDDMFGPGQTADMDTGDGFGLFINPQDLPQRQKALSDHFADEGEYDCEYRVRTRKGDFCWVHDRGQATRSDSGQPLRMQGVLRAITVRKQNEARLEYLANFDELTGHFNRTRLRESLDHALGYAKRYKGGSGAYLVVGIEKLGDINDTYGYTAADTLIVTVGQRLERSLRDSDVIGRIGGDRFGVVLTTCSEEAATAIAGKIIEAVNTKALDTPNGPVNAAVAVGMVAFPGLADTVHDIMTKAETALHEAKRRKHDSLVIYDLSDDQRDKRLTNLRITEDVRAALKESRLVFAYQPVVAAATEKTAYHECLLRLRESDSSLVSAGGFIPIIEQMGLARLIDRHVLEMTISDLVRHPAHRLAMNISGITAADQPWLRSLVAQLKGRPELAERLIIEITETAAMQYIEESARFITALRDLGCHVSLDDFGAGYTSFHHLKSLPVDVLKIDGSFIQGLPENPDNQLFVRTMLGLAEGFGMKTVAECVETKAEAEMLKEFGVDYFQGYFFARPEVDALAQGQDEAVCENAGGKAQGKTQSAGA